MLRSPPMPFAVGRHAVALLVVAALGLWLGPAACREPPATAERIVFSSNRDGLDGSRHLWMVEPDDPSSLAQLTTERTIDRAPALSPDGALVAFVRASRAAPDALRLWIRSLPDGRETPVTTDPPNAEVSDTEPFWAPDGRTLGFSRTVGSGPNGPVVQTLWSVRVSRLGTGVGIGPLVRIASDVGGNRFHGSWNPATGSDLLFSRFVGGYAPYTIWRLEPPTGVEREVVPHGCCGNYQPVYRPDGRRFAYASLQYNQHGGDLFVARADGTGATRVTCESGWMQPAWSPDGAALVAERLTAPPRLWRFVAPDIDGPCAEPVPVTMGPYLDAEPTWGIVRLR